MACSAGRRLHQRIGRVQRIRNAPLPPTYDVFIRLICWLYGYALFVSFTHQGFRLDRPAAVPGVITAERIGAYVEGPFDQDGSSFCVPMDVVSAPSAPICWAQAMPWPAYH